MHSTHSFTSRSDHRSGITAAQDTRCMFDLEEVKPPPRPRRILDDDDEEEENEDGTKEYTEYGEAEEEEEDDEEHGGEGVRSRHSGADDASAQHNDPSKQIREAVLAEMEHLNSKGFTFMTPDMRELFSNMSPRRVKEYEARVQLRMEEAIASVEEIVLRSRKALHRREVFDPSINEARLASTLHVELQRRVRPRDIKNSVLREMVEENRFRQSLGREKFERLEDRLSDMFRGTALTPVTATGKEGKESTKKKMLAPRFVAPMVRRWRKRVKKRLSLKAAESDAALAEEMRLLYYGEAAVAPKDRSPSPPQHGRSSGKLSPIKPRRSSADMRFEEQKRQWLEQKAQKEVERQKKAEFNKRNMTVRSQPVFIRAEKGITGKEMEQTRSWAIQQGILPTGGAAGPEAAGASMMDVQGRITTRREALKQATEAVAPLTASHSTPSLQGGKSGSGSSDGGPGRPLPSSSAAIGPSGSAKGHSQAALMRVSLPSARALQRPGLLSLQDLAKCASGAQRTAADRLALLKGKYIPPRVREYEQLLLEEPATLPSQLNGHVPLAERRKRLAGFQEFTEAMSPQKQLKMELKKLKKLQNRVELDETTRTRALGAKKHVSLKPTRALEPIEVNFDSPREVREEGSLDGSFVEGPPSMPWASPGGGSIVSPARGPQGGSDDSTEGRDAALQQPQPSSADGGTEGSGPPGMPGAAAGGEGSLDDSERLLRQVKALWVRLQMPAQQRFDFLIKYVLRLERAAKEAAKAGDSEQLPALPTGPKQLSLSLHEQRLLLDLGIDPHMRPSHYREGLQEVKQHLEKFADELFVNFDDVLTFRGLDYIASVANNSLAAVPQALNPALRRYGSVLSE